MVQNIKYLNLIVASPGDVAWERNKIVDIAKEINQILSLQYGLELRVLRWETDTHPGFHLEGLQGQIDEILGIDTCDIMVGVFWKRFGTPVQDADSGTEHELNKAFQAWRATGGKRPQTMIYFNSKPYKCESEEEEKQFARVLGYKKKLSSQGLSWEYKSRTEFEKNVRDHLLKFLLKNIGQLGGKTYKVIQPAQALINLNQQIVSEAETHLYMTGSRTRDQQYLDGIKQRLQEVHSLVIYRVLFGPPHHQMLKTHLQNLLEIRDPNDRKFGQQTIHLGYFDDFRRQPESFIIGNERRALVLLPSLLGVGEYNCGILFTGEDDVQGLHRFVKDLYNLSRKIETMEAITALNCYGEKNKTTNQPSEEANT
jgi:hypothetical protein